MPSRLARAHQQRSALYRDRLVAQTGAMWSELGPGPELNRKLVPAVLVAQRRQVALTDGYLSVAAGGATGTATRPFGLRSDAMIGVHSRRGVTLETVYNRSRDYRDRLIDSGSTFVAADSAALARLEQAVVTDLALTRRYAATAHMVADERIVGYRRVLGGGGVSGNCGLCVVASTQRYNVEDLQGIHPHCDCSVESIIGPFDPGRVIDRDRLDEVTNQIDAGEYDKTTLGRLRFDPDQLDPADLPAGWTAREITDMPQVEVINSHPEIPALLWNADHDFNSLN